MSSEKRKKKEKTPTNFDSPSLQWLSCREHLPIDYNEDDKSPWLLVYSETHYLFYIARFSPFQGWLNQVGEQIECVTHWLNGYSPFFFPIKIGMNNEKCKEYKIRDYNSD
jgi:hypothetical protein